MPGSLYILDVWKIGHGFLDLLFRIVIVAEITGEELVVGCHMGTLNEKTPSNYYYY